MVDKIHNYGERDLALKINELIDALDAVGADTLTGSPVAQADTAGGATLATLITDFNALLAKLRTRGVLAP
jgi:hypothetical protein